MGPPNVRRKNNEPKYPPRHRRARQIAALGADPEKSFRVWADVDGPVRGYGLDRRRNEGGPGGPLRVRRLL